jgi:hypothetical protein
MFALLARECCARTGLTLSLDIFQTIQATFAQILAHLLPTRISIMTRVFFTPAVNLIVDRLTQ